MASSKRSGAWRQIAEDDFESAFHLLLGRLVHAIARLDFTMGLQLRYWAHKDEPRVRTLLKPGNARLNDRLEALEELVGASWSGAHTEGQEEMSRWFERAHKARGVRNEYVHGRWAAPGKHSFTESGRVCDAMPLLVFMPLDWDMSENREDKSLTLTLEEFAAQVVEAEQLTEQLWRIEKKYGENLYPGRTFPSS